MKLEPSPQVVFLVGFMGAGKSRVGRALAGRLGWRFLDLDHRVEARTGRSVARMFRDSGEAAFRRVETEELRKLLRELQHSRGTVVALGGGVPAQAANRRLLRGRLTVFLDVPVRTLWQRCRAGRGTRPLVKDAGSFRRLYVARRPRYLAAAMRVREAGRSPRQLAAEIAQRLGFGSRQGGRPQETP